MSKRPLCASTVRPAGASSSCPDRPVLRARRSSPQPVARFRWWSGSPRRHRRVLRRHTEAGAMSVPDFEVLGAHAESYAAVPTINLRLRIRAGTGAPVDRGCLTVSYSHQPQFRSLQRRRGRTSARSLRRGAAVGRLREALCLDARRDDDHRLHGFHRDRSARDLHIRP